MGKIVKYCGKCEESFAEKFGFCPTCGGTLKAFEMNPVAAEAARIAEAKAADAAMLSPVAPVEKSADIVATAPIVEPVNEIPEPIAESSAPVITTPTTRPFVVSKPVDVDRKSNPRVRSPIVSRDDDDGFHVTVIQEKNAGQRNLLMLGSLAFVVVTLMSGLVYNIFSKDLDIGAINNDDLFNAVLIDTQPMTVEEEVQKKEKNNAGGGGGGGREEKEKTTQGDLADQTPNPIRPPDAHVPRMDNPSLVLPPPSTQGDKKFEKKFETFGDPTGRFKTLSNGDGSGGGQGSGRGTGQGNGNGTGAGNGNGSGFGNGDGDGNGNGNGSGTAGGNLPPPPPERPKITQAMRIISKPKPSYTDAARTNNIQGTVILRVTFLASGQIGDVSPVKGLPNGLTEQAIAAARRISFEPKKIDGQGQSVTRQVEFSFAIY